MANKRLSRRSIHKMEIASDLTARRVGIHSRGDRIKAHQVTLQRDNLRLPTSYPSERERDPSPSSSDRSPVRERERETGLGRKTERKRDQDRRDDGRIFRSQTTRIAAKKEQGIAGYAMSQSKLYFEKCKARLRARPTTPFRRDPGRSGGAGRKTRHDTRSKVTGKGTLSQRSRH